MVHILAVALGGAVGAVGRYAVSYAVSQHAPSAFPWGTLTVNLIGSLILGFLTGLVAESLVSPRARAFVGVGFLGSFTTFSTFAMETLTLIRQGEWIRAVGNLTVTNLVGIAAAAAGLLAARAAVLYLRRG